MNCWFASIIIIEGWVTGHVSHLANYNGTAGKGGGSDSPNNPKFRPKNLNNPNFIPPIILNSADYIIQFLDQCLIIFYELSFTKAKNFTISSEN